VIIASNRVLSGGFRAPAAGAVARSSVALASGPKEFARPIGDVAGVLTPLANQPGHALVQVTGTWSSVVSYGHESEHAAWLS